MASLSLDSTALDRIGLPPRRGAKGPVTAARQRRTWTIYLVLCATGLIPTVLGLSPALQAAGLGLWIPGGGFVAVGGWWSLLFPLILVLFVAAIVAWFWAGIVLAPATVWLGSAALAGLMAGHETWSGAPIVVPLAAGGVILTFHRRLQTQLREGHARAAQRENFLRRSLVEVEAMASHEPAPEFRELDADQLAGLRYLLDRTLQPVDSFAGFTVIDQFQPAALRYQINHMGFALGIAQSAYLPNFRGYMGLAQRNLIEKYLNRKVWDYWVLESCWGHLNFIDWNPAGRDNIMLTGWFGAHVGQYMLATGDRRYMEPGSLTFRLNARKAWAHDFTTLVGSVDSNYRDAEFGMYACEPNWIYPICNHYGMLSLVTHDALQGSDLVSTHLPRWVEGMDTEFTDAAGSIIGLRSQLTGLPIPFPSSEAGYAFFENAFLPRRARQQWAIARKELEPLLVNEGCQERLAFPGEGLDAGKYASGHTGSYATMLVAAREFGDTRIANAAKRGLERDCEPSREGGVLRYNRGSNLTNATAVLGLLMQAGDFRRSFTAPPAGRALEGPMIETLQYPEVLVARAFSDGDGLDAVFHPGVAPGCFTVPISQLKPGARYAVSGAREGAIVADGSGRASVTIDLAGRTELALRPAA